MGIELASRSGEASPPCLHFFCRASDLACDGAGRRLFVQLMISSYFLFFVVSALIQAEVD